MTTSSKPERQYSTAWWNVIRRRMTATPITHTESPPCPDCNGETSLWKGKYGRFYKCVSWPCEGTVGARLDGTPREEKADEATVEARKRARQAVGRLIDLRVELHKLEPKPKTTFHRIGYSERDIPEGLYAEILSVAEVPHYVTSPRMKRVEPMFDLSMGVIFTKSGKTHRGLFLRRRTREEALKIAAAAESLGEHALSCLRVLRHSQWDRIALGTTVGECFDTTG